AAVVSLVGGIEERVIGLVHRGEELVHIFCPGHWSNLLLTKNLSRCRIHIAAIWCQPLERANFRKWRTQLRKTRKPTQPITANREALHLVLACTAICSAPACWPTCAAGMHTAISSCRNWERPASRASPRPLPTGRFASWTAPGWSRPSGTRRNPGPRGGCMPSPKLERLCSTC